TRQPPPGVRASFVLYDATAVEDESTPGTLIHGDVTGRHTDADSLQHASAPCIQHADSAGLQWYVLEPRVHVADRGYEHTRSALIYRNPAGVVTHGHGAQDTPTVRIEHDHFAWPGVAAVGVPVLCSDEDTTVTYVHGHGHRVVLQSYRTHEG